MINENTMDTLQSLAFGADIDALESYLVDFKLAERASNIDRYRHNYNILYSIFEELKPNSKLFTDDGTNTDLSNDQFDKMFEQYGNIRKSIMYGITDTMVMSDVREKMNKATDSVSDILALVNAQGLDIMCTYKDGYLCKAYVIGESKKILDITDSIEEVIPVRLKELSQYNLVELRGKLTVSKTQDIKSSLHTETYVAHCIRCNINIDTLVAEFNDILSEELSFKTQWDKLEFLNSLDINVANYALVRGIDCDLLPQALVDIDKALADLGDDISFKNYGFEVRLNDYTDNTTGFICVLDDADYRRTYESIVKSITTKEFSNEQVLKIVQARCNKRFNIDSIIVKDIYNLEKYNIAIGEKVNFKVIEGNAILVES